MSNNQMQHHRRRQTTSSSLTVQNKRASKWLAAAAATLAISTSSTTETVAFVPKLGISVFSKSPTSSSSSAPLSSQLWMSSAPPPRPPFRPGSNNFGSVNYGDNYSGNQNEGENDDNDTSGRDSDSDNDRELTSNDPFSVFPPMPTIDPSKNRGGWSTPSPFSNNPNDSFFGSYSGTSSGNNAGSGPPPPLPQQAQSPFGSGPPRSQDAGSSFGGADTFPGSRNAGNIGGPFPPSQQQQQQQSAFADGQGNGNPADSWSSEENDAYYSSKMAQQDAKREQRRQQAADGLQERVAAKLREAETKRLAEDSQQKQREELVREAEEWVQETKASTDPREANARWQAESEARIAEAAEEAKRKSWELKRENEEAERERQRRRAESAARVQSDAAAAARAKAEELRREWEAEHPGESSPLSSSSSEMPSSPFPSNTDPFNRQPFNQQAFNNGPGKSQALSSPFGIPGPSQRPERSPFSTNADTGSTQSGAPWSTRQQPEQRANIPTGSKGQFSFSSSPSNSEDDKSDFFGTIQPGENQQQPSGGSDSRANQFSAKARPTQFGDPFGQAQQPLQSADSSDGNSSDNKSDQKEEASSFFGGFNPFGKKSETVPSDIASSPFNPFSARKEDPSRKEESGPPISFNPFGGGFPKTSSDSNVENPFGSYNPGAASTPAGKSQDIDDYYAAEMARRAAAKEKDPNTKRIGGNESAQPPIPAVFTPLDAQAVNQEAEEEKARLDDEKRREEAKARFRSNSDRMESSSMNDFKAQQEAAMKAEQEARLEAERRRAEEAKRQEDEANRIRAEQEAKRRADQEAAAEEEKNRRSAIRAAEDKARGQMQDQNRMQAQEEQQRRAEAAALQRRVEEARRRAAAEQEKLKQEEEEKRRKAEQARIASIEAARKMRVEEEARKAAAELAKKRAEEERMQQARKRVEGKKYKEEADSDRKEIKDFVQNKRREIDAKRVQADDQQRINDEARYRADEARIWAEQEARRKKGGVMNEEDEEVLRIRNVYAKWCEFYGKRFDEARLETFAQNLVDIEAHFSKAGGPVQLNEFADLTAEEYQRREEDPEIWEENERLRMEQARLWDEEVRLGMAGERPWGRDEDFLDSGLLRDAEYFGPPPLEEDPWRRDEQEWGLPPYRPQVPSMNDNAPSLTPQERLSPFDEAKRRGELELARKAELEAHREEARKEAEAEERRLMEEAKRRGEETSRIKSEQEARKKAEEDAKRQAVEEAKRRGEEEAKRKAEIEAKRKKEEKIMEDARQKALEEARLRGEAAARQKTETEKRESERALETKKAQGVADLGKPFVPVDGKSADLGRVEELKNQYFSPSSKAQGTSRQISVDNGHPRFSDRAVGGKATPSTSQGSFSSQNSPFQEKAIDTWNAALERGQEVARKQVELEAKRKDEEARLEEEKRNFYKNATERARDEAQKRVETAERKKREVEEARTRLIEEAKRRAEEEQRKREEAQARRREEIAKAADLELQRKEEIKRQATEAAQRREAEQKRIREERARQIEEERQRNVEAKQRLAEEAKRKADELAKQREERIRLAMEDQKSKEEARKRAAEVAKRRAQDIEMAKAEQLKRVQEEKRNQEERRKQIEADKRAEQEAREVARLGARRQAALDLAKKREDQEAEKRQREDQARQAARQAAKQRNEEERRRREETATKTRIQSDQEIQRKRDAAVKFNSRGATSDKAQLSSMPKALVQPFEVSTNSVGTGNNSGEDKDSSKTKIGQKDSPAGYVSPSTIPTKANSDAGSKQNYNPFERPKATLSSPTQSPFGSYLDNMNQKPEDEELDSSASSEEAEIKPSDIETSQVRTVSSVSPPTFPSITAIDTESKRNYNPFQKPKTTSSSPQSPSASDVPDDSSASQNPAEAEATFNPLSGASRTSDPETETGASTSSFGSFMGGPASSSSAKKNSKVEKTDQEVKKTYSPFGSFKFGPSEKSVQSQTKTSMEGSTPEASREDRQVGKKSYSPFGSFKFGPGSKQQSADTTEDTAFSSTTGEGENDQYSPFGTFKSSSTDPPYMRSETSATTKNEESSRGVYSGDNESSQVDLRSSTIAFSTQNQSNGPGKTYSPFGSFKRAKAFSRTPSSQQIQSDEIQSPTEGRPYSPFDSFEGNSDASKQAQPDVDQSIASQSSGSIPSPTTSQADDVRKSFSPFGSFKNNMGTNISTTSETSTGSISSSREEQKKTYAPFGSYKSATAPSSSIGNPGPPSYEASPSQSEQPTPGASRQGPPTGSYTGSVPQKSEENPQETKTPPPVPARDKQDSVSSVSGSIQNAFTFVPQDSNKDIPRSDSISKAAQPQPQRKITDDATAAKVQAELARRQAEAKKEKAERAAQTAQQMQAEAQKWDNGVAGKSRESTSYMDRVAKSYVAGSSRLEDLNQQIAKSSSSPSIGKDTSSEETAKGKASKDDTGIVSFVSRFFGGKGPDGKNTQQAPMVQWKENDDGTLTPESSDVNSKELEKVTSVGQNNGGGQGLPFYLSRNGSSGIMTSEYSSNLIEGSPSSATQPMTTTIPTISAWSQTPEGSIHGFISGSPNFEDGAYIITTPVNEKDAMGGSIVTTASGSQYRLSTEPNPSTEPVVVDKLKP